MKNKLLQKMFRKKIGGFILPLTLIVTTIIVTVSVGVSNIILKQTLFSFLTRVTSIAYYAADTGLACAIYIDDTYLDQETGIGIMPYKQSLDPIVYVNNTLTSVNDYRTSRGVDTITLDNIVCGTTKIFDIPTSNFTSIDWSYTYTKPDLSIETENGKSNSFDMSMDLGDGEIRCASVTVNKTPTYRQIISRGYSKCGKGINRIERAVVSSSEGY